MKLVLLYGAPAAGKLTVAVELAQVIGYPMLDNHRLTDYVREIFPRSDATLASIGSQLGRKLRLEVFEAAAQAGVDLISTFAPLSEGAFDFMRSICTVVESAGGTVCLVQLRPDQETLLERVTGESRLGKKLDDVKRWRQVTAGNPEAFATFPDREHLVVDNSHLTPLETAWRIAEYYGLKSSATAVEQV